MGMDSNNCWLGNYCQDKSSGGCPAGQDVYMIGITSPFFDLGHPQQFPKGHIVSDQNQPFSDPKQSHVAELYNLFCQNMFIVQFQVLASMTTPIMTIMAIMTMALALAHVTLKLTPRSDLAQPLFHDMVSNNIQECNSTEIYCDAGNDGQGCWLGNYCIAQVAFPVP